MSADATDQLDKITMPTLILHSLGDRMNDFEHSRVLAAGIAGARLVPLDSSNHIVLEDEPAWAVWVDEVTRFCAPDRALAPESGPAVETLLSARELEVLRLAADGLDNDAIAETLTLSVRTVERHLQNAYLKLGIRGRSARTAAVARLLTSA
jgi:DNA-binding NarL/FixJ family response regulator